MESGIFLCFISSSHTASWRRSKSGSLFSPAPALCFSLALPECLFDHLSVPRFFFFFSQVPQFLVASTNFHPMIHHERLLAFHFCRRCAPPAVISWRGSPISGCGAPFAVISRRTKPPQEPRMIASFDTMVLVPNNVGVGKQVVISVASQLDRELGSNQGRHQLFDDA
jgi:hypothetical protein